MAQAESRAHRYGQQGTVKCQYLLARGTADDLIWEMLKNKQQVLNKAGLFNDDLADGAFLMGPVVVSICRRFLYLNKNCNCFILIIRERRLINMS